MNDLGRVLVWVGIILVILGGLLWSGVGRGWFGQLPGDVHISRGGYHFYFPVMTCILVSIILSLLLWWFRR